MAPAEGAGDGTRAADEAARPASQDERPPLLGRWSALYALVIAELVAVIALCGWLAGYGR